MAGETLAATCRNGHRMLYRPPAGRSVKCRVSECRVSLHIPKSADRAAGIGTGLDALWEAEDALPADVDHLLDDGATYADPCPTCGTARTWEPRRTLPRCPACHLLSIPGFVVDRYRTREAGALVPRAAGGAVVDQEAADDAALELAEARGLLADRIREVLADERLRADSRHRLGWYADEIGRAGSMERLEYLAERLRSERIRRVGWFSSDVDPAEILDGELVDDDDGAEEYDDGQEHAAIEAPAAPVADWRDALTIRSYEINPDAEPGQCQISKPNWAGGPVGPWPCQGGAFRTWGPLRVCPSCANTLSHPLP